MPKREIVEALLLATDVRLDGDELNEMAEAYPELLQLEKTVQILSDQKITLESLFSPASDGYLDE